MSDLAAAAAARAASRATRTITTGQIDLALSWARGEITLADAEKLIGKTGPPYPLLARSLAEAVRSGRLVEGRAETVRRVEAARPEVVAINGPGATGGDLSGWTVDIQPGEIVDLGRAMPCPYTGCQREAGHAGDCAANFTSQTEK